MLLTENMVDIIVKKSKISRLGVFANRDFKKGEIVLRQNPKLLDKDNLDKLSKEEKNYVSFNNDKVYLMQPPERYVNHSCEDNTISQDDCDIALRDIQKGEEITSSYSEKDVLDGFKCNCGSQRCKGNL
jgi:SET domain-containing protein